MSLQGLVWREDRQRGSQMFLRMVLFGWEYVLDLAQ
jgi:hypothetical protein